MMQTANAEAQVRSSSEERRVQAAASLAADSSIEQSVPAERLVVLVGGRAWDGTLQEVGYPDTLWEQHQRDAIPADSASDWVSRVGKRTLDIIGSVALTVIFAPIILPVMLFMLLRGESVIYKHKRVGRGGKIFECFKFCTMVPDADKVLQDLLDSNPALKTEWLRTQKLRNDPRVTRIGRFLRRTSLDELPQIWNVLQGEMSLVGPRPITREELMRYGRNTAVYLAAKPGITGLWQVSGRSDTDYRRRVAMDVYYVRNKKFRLDMYILFKTISVVLGGGGAY